MLNNIGLNWNGNSDTRTAMPCLRHLIEGPWQRRPLFNARPGHVGLAVDQLALRIFSKYFSSALSVSFHQCSILILSPITDATQSPQLTTTANNFVLHVVYYEHVTWCKIYIVSDREAEVAFPASNIRRGRSLCPCGLRRRSSAAWLLGSRVRNPLRAWMFVSSVFVCCVGRVLPVVCVCVKSNV
jgi:hypothetical protein